MPASIWGLREWRGGSRKLLLAAQEAGLHHAVVFVRVDDPQQYLQAFPYNSPFFDTDLILPRCLGSMADGRLMQCFPDRRAHLAALGPEGWQITPYPQHYPVPASQLGLVGVDGTRPQMPPEPGQRPDELAQQVAMAYPGWELLAAPDSPALGVFSRLNGKENVIKLHPISPNVPAVLRWTGALGAGMNHALSFAIGPSPEAPAADTVVQVWVDDRYLGGARTDQNGPGQWLPCRYDLSSFAGQQVTVDLLVVATGWYFEYACIADLEVN